MTNKSRSSHCKIAPNHRWFWPWLWFGEQTWLTEMRAKFNRDRSLAAWMSPSRVNKRRLAINPRRYGKNSKTIQPPRMNVTPLYGTSLRCDSVSMDAIYGAQVDVDTVWVHRPSHGMANVADGISLRSYSPTCPGTQSSRRSPSAKIAKEGW